MKQLAICFLLVMSLGRNALANVDELVVDNLELQAVKAVELGAPITSSEDPSPSEVALACPSGWVPCGANHCVPSGTVCCASAGHPELYCQAGYVCQTNGTCTPSSGGGTCPSGQKVCGNNFCIPSTGVCCDSQGHYCNAGYTCSGTQCVPSTGGGGSQTCGSGQRLSDWDCGGTASDVCGCADACSSGSNCQSGCCVNGFCAPGAACQSQCSITYGTCGDSGGSDNFDDGGGGGFGGGDGGGCSSSSTSGLGMFALLLLGLGWQRARGVRGS